MRMKAEHVSRLYELMDLPHLSRRTKLILARRIARHLIGECKPARYQAKRQVRQVATAYQCRVGTLPGANSFNWSLAAIGVWVCRNEGLIEKIYGFNGICDLLNVNPVHRASLHGRGTGKNAGVLEIVLGAGLEDSAANLSGRFPAELKEGALYQALWQEMKRAYAGDRNV